MVGALSRGAVEQALSAVLEPSGRFPLTETGRLSEIVIREGQVVASIAIEATEAATWEATRVAAEQAIRAVPGVTGVAIALTAERGTVTAPPASSARPTGNLSMPQSGAAQPAANRGFPNLSGVRHIVAVASGKGGVGKSTTACNVALSLSMLSDGGRRLRVGILDADIYGPSMPKLLALRGQPRILSGRTLEPLDAFGCKVMSIGFIVEADKAMIWRGPMVASAVTQLLRDVAWGELDVLVVDMPPGTGDAQLTLAQQAPLAGAVIVSTPQDLALIDARRGVAMFRETGVPILGLVENMSYFECDGCGKRHHVFAHGGARDESVKLGVPFLGEIPLDLVIRERSDAGMPVVMAEPDGAPAAAYRAIAHALWQSLCKG